MRLAALADGFARWGHQRPWTVVGLALLTALAGLGGVSRLGVDQDLRALLPPDAPSVRRLDMVEAAIGTHQDLIVEIRSPDRAANRAFGAALTDALKDMPEIRWVAFRYDLDFLEKNAALLAPLPDLLRLRRVVIDKLAEATEAKMQVLDAPEGARGGPRPASAFDGEGLGEKLRKKLGLTSTPSEYLEADEGRILVIKARPTAGTSDIAFATRLVARTRGVISRLAPTSFHPKMRARIKGEFPERTRQSDVLRGDILSTLIFALALLMAVIGGHYRRLRAAPIVLLPVALSTMVTLAIGTAIYGTFNIVTTFIFAILLGLGVDFSIHCLSRFGHERERGLDSEEALRVALRSTGGALLSGGATTAAVFTALALGRFQGFAQFGVVAAIGVALALLSTFGLTPALITLAERRRPWTAGRAPKPSAPRTTRLRPGITSSRIVVVVAGALAIGSLLRLGDVPFEYDFRKLGPPKKAPTSSAGPSYKDAVGKVTTFAPAVVVCGDRATCDDVARLLSVLLRAPKWDATPPGPPSPKIPDDDDDDDDWGDDEEVNELDALEASLEGGRLLPEERALFESLGPWKKRWMVHYLKAYLGLQLLIPERQDDKLKVIADIRERIERKRGMLSAAERKHLDRWRRTLSVSEPVTEDDLPAWAREQLSGDDGGLGRFLILWNSGPKTSYRTATRLHRGFFDLPVEGGAAVAPAAANYFVFVEVIDTLKEDGPRVLGWAMLAVLFCLTALFRSLRLALLTLVPLLTSMAWLAGTHVALDWKLNLFNVVAYPLLAGMGIDNGIHVMHRWLEERDVGVVLAELLGPITLTTVTTSIGFLGLTFASHRGIRSLGLTAATGMGLAYLGAVVVLPAVLTLLGGGQPDDASDEA